jgi:hypothetical protein
LGVGGGVGFGVGGGVGLGVGGGVGFGVGGGVGFGVGGGPWIVTVASPSSSKSGSPAESVALNFGSQVPAGSFVVTVYCTAWRQSGLDVAGFIWCSALPTITRTYAFGSLLGSRYITVKVMGVVVVPVVALAVGNESGLVGAATAGITAARTRKSAAASARNRTLPTTSTTAGTARFVL